MQKVTCLLLRFGLPLRKNLMNILRTGGLKEESFPKFPLAGISRIFCNSTGWSEKALKMSDAYVKVCLLFVFQCILIM